MKAMKKKVLIYSDCNLFGGSEHVIYNIIRNPYLKEKFSFLYRYSKLYQDKVIELSYSQYCDNLYSIHLLTNYTIYRYLKSKITIRIIRRILFLPFYILEIVGFYKFINRIIIDIFIKKHHDYAIVHINNGGYPGAYSCLQFALGLRKYPKIRTIMQVNNLAQSGYEKIDGRVCSSVDQFITASQNARKALLLKRKIKPSKVTTLSNYVEDVSIQYGKGCKEDLNDGTITILQVALLQERKGQKYLIDALKILNANSSVKYHLLLIGNGECYNEIKQYIKLQGVEACVQLLGYRDDYLDYVNKADVIALPSIKDEDMPLIILSSMALSKAIVSTDIGGIPEEIIDGVSGILVSPKEDGFSYRLADAIKKAYKERKVIGENARRRYEECFSAQSYAKNIVRLYNE